MFAHVSGCLVNNSKKNIWTFWKILIFHFLFLRVKEIYHFWAYRRKWDITYKWGKFTGVGMHILYLWTKPVLVFKTAFCKILNPIHQIRKLFLGRSGQLTTQSFSSWRHGNESQQSTMSLITHYTSNYLLLYSFKSIIKTWEWYQLYQLTRQRIKDRTDRTFLRPQIHSFF